MIKESLTKISEAIKPIHVIFISVAGIASICTSVWLFAVRTGYDKAKKEVKEVSYESKIDQLIVSDGVKTKQLNSIDSILILHFKQERVQEGDFKALERSYVNTLTFINRLDEIIKYYESKVETERMKNFPDISIQKINKK